MVVIGIDSHKSTHTAVAVDGNGRKLAERPVAARAAGHLELVRWAGPLRRADASPSRTCATCRAA